MSWEVSPEEYERWQLGGEDEKKFWATLDEEEFRAQERGYRSLAEQIDRKLLDYGVGHGGRILQVGCAVEDVVFYLEGGERFAVDPHADFYKETFARSRNPRVDYRQAMGESVPFDDGYFSMVICQNLLDHVANYHVVLQEVQRVLGEPNLTFFGTDVYEKDVAEERWARLANGEIFDILHPHTFTEQSLEEELTSHGFEILERYPPQPSGKGDSSYRHCLFARSR